MELFSQLEKFYLKGKPKRQFFFWKKKTFIRETENLYLFQKQSLKASVFRTIIQRKRTNEGFCDFFFFASTIIVSFLSVSDTHFCYKKGKHSVDSL